MSTREPFSHNQADTNSNGKRNSTPETEAHTTLHVFDGCAPAHVDGLFETRLQAALLRRSAEQPHLYLLRSGALVWRVAVVVVVLAVNAVSLVVCWTQPQPTSAHTAASTTSRHAKLSALSQAYSLTPEYEHLHDDNSSSEQ
jgi:hypothetical protein